MTGRFAVLPLVAAGVATAFIASPAAAQDASVAERLDEQGMSYEIEGGNYKINLSLADRGRTQLVYVSGEASTYDGLKFRLIVAPAGSVEDDKIDGAKALALLSHSTTMKLGGWQLLSDGHLVLAIKALDTASSAELGAMIKAAAYFADDREIELSGDRDAY